MATLLFIFILLGVRAPFPQDAACVLYCQCTTAPESRQTVWGHSPRELRPLKTNQQIKGIVVVDGTDDPLADVLVEVYDRPKLIAKAPFERDKVGRHRLAACITGKAGRFFFELQPGNYELRLSRSAEWDATFLHISVGKGRHSEPLKLSLTVAH